MRELLRRADLVLTGGASLFEAKRELHPNVHAFPSSVDVPHFARVRTMRGEPDDQWPIPNSSGRLRTRAPRSAPVVYEYPRAEGDPYYPVPRPENVLMDREYQALAERTSGVYFTGRLATYKYYNMDQVVAQSLVLHKKLAAGVRRPRAIAQTA